MTAKRLWHTLRLWTLMGSTARMDYLRRKKVFASIGEGSTIMARKVPLYANLIKIGNNAHLASGVNFITHDATSSMLNRMPGAAERKTEYREIIGCIEIGDNVFVGANATILYDVRIGNNVIVGAGSIVNRDVEDNSVVAGVPARRICSFEEYLSRRDRGCSYPEGMGSVHQEVGPELAEWLWKDFETKRS